MSQENESAQEEQPGKGSREASPTGTARQSKRWVPTPFPKSPTAVSQADGEA